MRLDCTTSPLYNAGYSDVDYENVFDLSSSGYGFVNCVEIKFTCFKFSYIGQFWIMVSYDLNIFMFTISGFYEIFDWRLNEFDENLLKSC